MVACRCTKLRLQLGKHPSPCLQGAADKVVSDAVSMAMLLGTALGVAMYAAAPWLLARIAGPASAEVVAPALVYVRIRRV